MCVKWTCVCVCFRGEVSEGWGCSAESSCGNHGNVLLQRPGSSDQLGHSKYSQTQSRVPTSPRLSERKWDQVVLYRDFPLGKKKELVYVWGRSFPLDSEVNLLKLQTLGIGGEAGRLSRTDRREGKQREDIIFIFLTHKQVSKSTIWQDGYKC